ncbi:MAG: molecular chaperone HtpG [Butyricicoccus pullicaecorum]|jgi:molecular chaperone HtpG|nr:molecular chaperone HtpG [Butyricicoccus pullicaecorum]
MAKKEFQAESKRLLDLMIHSIYTHHEIFLRELISNASDATDKLYYNAMQEGKTGITRDSLPIHIALDKEARTLTISDHGCGMTAAELEENLGTIARSGSLAFKQQMDKAEDVDIIGQFGVGFYAAFMVAKTVTVTSRSEKTGEANCWVSDGADGYTITPAEKAEAGTDIVLTIKDNTETENYDEYLEPYRIQSIVRKYSDYIRYPIQMDMPRSRMKEGCDPEKPEYEDYMELTTLNSMVPIWKKAKSELKDEDYNNFYKSKYYDFKDPVRHIHMNTEGAVTFNALLFIPASAPFNYYTKDYEKGLQLYSNGVLIMERCADLLPDHFNFVRGLVDTADLSLNISREMLQHDRHLKLIASNLEKKIKSELLSLLKNDREKYETFFKAFGMQLKYGAYVEYGAHKELLQDLLMYHSVANDKMATLDEYVAGMKEDQKYIYYACGENTAKISLLPQMERLRDKGYDVLCMTDNIDEFCIKMMRDYKDKEFKSITDGDLGLESEDEKQEVEKLTEENKDLLAQMKEALGDKVSKVQLTSRLKSHPCCLSTEGMISLEMEKVLAEQRMGDEQTVKAERVLELNAGHPIFQKLISLSGDAEKLKTYTQILYAQAQLIEGLSLEDPVAYANAVCSLLSE